MAYNTAKHLDALTGLGTSAVLLAFACHAYLGPATSSTSFLQSADL
jgi:hypothetical protein